MKKTVSIQISGMLFHVDDDAYARLDAYLQSIRSHFAHLADRDEIVSDIESRIAETFAEKLKKSKQTVTLTDVESLIEKMGTVEDFEAFEGETDEERTQTPEAMPDTREPPRRFYRNPDDKVIAGVASGIASYFNIDPVIIRVIFVILGFLHGMGVIAYIVLWFAMPLAKTQGERMEMRGEPMTLGGLDKKIRRSTHSFETSDFHSIYARGGIRLYVRRGKDCSVEVRGAPRDLLHTDIHVGDGQLRIEPMHGWWWGFHNGFRRLSFDITLPELKEVDVAGGCSVDVNGFDEKELTLRAVGASVLRATVNAATLHVHVEGASSGTIAGSGENIDITAIGASSLNARSFDAKKGHVDVSGASAGHVSATDIVDGTVSGACSLCVYGSPTVTAKASGGSSIKTKEISDHISEEWQQKETYFDHNNYTNRVPGIHIVKGIGGVIWAIVSVLLRFIGGIMTAVGIVAMIVLIVASIHIFQTGFIPYVNAGPMHLTSTLQYLTAGVGAFILLVPVILLMTFGASLIHLRRQFDTAGIATLIAFWMVAVVIAAVMGSLALRTIRQTAATPAVEQTFGAKDFDSIQANDSDTLLIQAGSGFSVQASGPQDAINHVHLLLQKNTLVIEHTKRTDFCLGCDVHAITFSITLPHIHTLTTGGLTSAAVRSVSGSSLTLISKDLSHISVSGQTDVLTLATHDLSSVDAMNLQAKQASVLLRGFSQANLTVLESIKGETHDISRLFYQGSALSDIHSSDWSTVHAQSLSDGNIPPTPNAPATY